MYLLDTNVCIYFMKNTYPILTEKLLSCDPANLLISSITVFELEYGAEKSIHLFRIIFRPLPNDSLVRYIIFFPDGTSDHILLTS